MTVNRKLNVMLAMQVYARVVETGTFTRAADSLRMPKPTVTKLVQALESHLRVKLLNRTTRKVTVTPDGAAYYERATRLLADLDDIESSVANAQASPKGHVRVDMGGSAASMFVIPALPAFVERYPEIQLDLRRRIERPRLVALDTMNYWITGKREALRRALAEVDALLVNDAEARMLTEEPNLIKAVRAILGYGPRVVVVKRGEYGVLMAADGHFFFTPAFPLESVFDPTGAGDTFAGGFMGVLARADRVDDETLRRAVVYGSVMASFAVEDFSLNRLTRLTEAEIEERFGAFREMMRLGH